MPCKVGQPPWYWLLPLSYGIHIAEEYWGGFVDWSARTSGTGLSLGVFLATTSAGAILSLLGIFLSNRRKRQAWIPITMASFFILNGIVHLAWTVTTLSYSPGLISGLLLWVPLGAAVLKRSSRIYSSSFFLKSAAGGFVLQAAVSLVVRLS
ncbi:MAG: HXXEE domain-containing protein [Acidobacteriota bacterium]